MAFSNRDIADYYNQTLVHYKTWWKLDETMAVHYGMWDKTTRNFKEALINTNFTLMQVAEVKNGARVLDAGCGVGGSAFFLAKQKNAKVTGITLSEKQIEFANRMNKNLNLSHQVDFKLEDYTGTSFAQETFDLIWAIESITSAVDKNKFAKEAFRVLKPGGKLIIADYFKTPGTKPDRNNWLEKWQNCWSLSEIMQEKPYLQKFEKEGFRLNKSIDVSSKIYPSSKIMYKFYLLGAIPSMLYNAFHKTGHFAKTHYRSGKYQYKALKEGLWEYKIILLTKGF